MQPGSPSCPEKNISMHFCGRREILTGEVRRGNTNVCPGARAARKGEAGPRVCRATGGRKSLQQPQTRGTSRDKAQPRSPTPGSSQPWPKEPGSGSKDQTKGWWKGQSRAASPAASIAPQSPPSPPHHNRAWGGRCQSAGTGGKASPRGPPSPPRSSLACRVPFPGCRSPGGKEQGVVNHPPPPPKSTLIKSLGQSSPWRARDGEGKGLGVRGKLGGPRACGFLRGATGGVRGERGHRG